MSRILAILSIYLLTMSTSVSVQAEDDDAKLLFFEQKIRPVLIKHCYECHSEESEKLSGMLQLDLAKTTRTGGESGPAVVPGKPDDSLLLAALKYETYEMPPSGRLAPSVVADFEKWIRDGAVDPRTDGAVVASGGSADIDIERGRKFWAFRPLQRTETPQIDPQWGNGTIDAFIFDALRSNALSPSAKASRRVLIRRLYYDLTGLPPTTEEVERFVADDAPDAYQNLVDKLLQSDQFGVQWGRHWMDVVRYADSNGADFNATFHNAWRYRDYIVDSFNNDKPFNQFVIEQIAGDLLPADTPTEAREQIIATGFLMVGTKMLSERDKLKLTMDVIDEQINVVGQAFMGMTLGCARCHDHKYDPIPTRDYYALAGIFQSTRTLQGESQKYVSTWPKRTLPVSALRLEEHQQHTEALASLETEKKKVDVSIQQLQKEIDGMLPQLKALLVDDTEATKTGVWKSSKLYPHFVGESYIHNDQDNSGERTITFRTVPSSAATYDIQLSYSPGSSRAAKVPITITQGDVELQLTMNQQPNPPIEQKFVSVGTSPFQADIPVTVTMDTKGTEGFVIADSLRLVELDEQGEPVVLEPVKPAPAITEKLAGLKTAQATFAKQIADLKKNAPAELPQAFAVEEAETIVNSQINVRGEHTNLGAEVPRGVLQVATVGQPPQIDDSQSGRLALARWIASPDNPLTARVMANRIWHHLIGQGIVASVDNFGTLGNRPTHPELLDYLATDLISNDWSIKTLVRQIVLSETYQQASQWNEKAFEVDPDNRFVWRMPRRRMTAESIRDSLLTASSELDLTPAPSPVAGLGTLVTNSSGGGSFANRQSNHRSVYLARIRSATPEILTLFDVANPGLVTGRRSVSTVPAQALYLLNSPFVMERAEKTAIRILENLPSQVDNSKLLNTIYMHLLSRKPTEAELALGTKFLGDPAKTEREQLKVQLLIQTLFATAEFRTID